MEMKNQTCQLENRCNLIFNLPVAGPASQPIQANSCDYGFDFDEEDLGRELLAPLPVNRTIREIPEINPEEFEPFFIWFNS